VSQAFATILTLTVSNLLAVNIAVVPARYRLLLSPVVITLDNFIIFPSHATYINFEKHRYGETTTNNCIRLGPDFLKDAKVTAAAMGDSVETKRKLEALGDMPAVDMTMAEGEASVGDL
jgi:hypothetical protein